MRMAVDMVRESAPTLSIPDFDMHCRQVAEILDESVQRDLSAAQCWELHEHLTICANCANAWRAQVRLLRLRIPLPSPHLCERLVERKDGPS